jgi:hypothetical protein
MHLAGGEPTGCCVNAAADSGSVFMLPPIRTPAEFWAAHGEP